MITRIREARRARGLTLAEVATRCDPPTTAQTIGRLETGMRTVSMGWLARIAGALGVAPSDLVTLPERVDVPLAAILTADGATAPTREAALAPPAPAPTQIALRVEAGQGDYRAGDIVWLDRLAPEAFAQALNRDVLVPRPVGRFVFGRLTAAAPARLAIQPVQPGERAVTLADPPWIAVAGTLIRAL